ncbi:MAG TPA: HPF/RaiA family ribosome-associated protein [Candidatus Paceibacterota bacterium]|nr:HPF/RaiA family ribosome-associated protein [Candidatus Paceibacterota bacterium]
MQIHFKGTNYELTSEHTAHAQKKLEGLRKYLGKGNEYARAYVDIGKETEAHQTGRIWYVDINFDADGTRFYAKAVEETIESAIDRAVGDLASALHTARKRHISMVRKGGVMLKGMMRGFGTQS